VRSANFLGSNAAGYRKIFFFLILISNKIVYSTLILRRAQASSERGLVKTYFESAKSI
jgi:hypothetical protein